MRRSLRTVVAASALLAAACADGTELPTAPSAAPRFAAQRDALADRYIVVFKRGTGSADRLTDELSRGGSVHFRYGTALLGFAATLPAAALEGIRRNPNVDYVVADGEATAIATQTSATWGIDRIDQRALPLSTTYNYDQTGAGVRAYILDTGIRGDHGQYAGRTAAGYTAVADGRGTEDCNGHGTHVAGTVGGTTYGVAKGVTIVPVRVLDCAGSGTWSGVIAGIDWVAANAVKPAVANMSLGGGVNTALNAAVTNAISSGVVFVVAGGNESTDACSRSPASTPAAITVGATTSSDARASYSNFGTCLDIFAPGSSITSAWYTSSTAINTISGTSMASPHVAGAAALVLGATPSATPAQVAATLTGNATPGVVTSAGTGSPNLLLYTLGGPIAPPPPPPPAEVDTVHVGSITNTAPVAKGKNWSVTVTTRVVDAAGAGVSGATVSGKWNNGATVSCLTGSSGACSLTSPTYKSSMTSTTWAVTAISGSNLAYKPSANVLTSLTITRP
ncbi:MAG: S8 family peptidase [Gemmatimonadales bacterium]|nr:S8 family peptidase [Gemmatimonadales bacterium]